ncbi:MAG: hypothetical protein PHO20_00820 [Candidatus Peribacteraceae bacterium]|nr:hypothetical protein [Candidatus Peribacteraceae bacterium]MDD5739292.1 hypothetical protein [Candidatus Peribacteraceae bacterium]
MPAPEGNRFALGNSGNTRTDYDPKYCTVAMRLGKNGGGIEELAAKLGVARKTVYAWMETHVEFGDAVTYMRELAEVHWRKVGADALFNRSFRERLYSLQMMNRFGWNKKEENTVQGNVAQAIATMYARIQARKKTPQPDGAAIPLSA